MYKEEKSEETKRRISFLASFSPAFRDLWEFRSLTPHAYFEPKGSYDRCTVLTRKRWMLLEEKRIGLSSQKMRARGEKRKNASPLYMSLCLLCYTQTRRKRKEKERARGLWCTIILCFILGMIFRGNCTFSFAIESHICEDEFSLSLSHTQTHIQLCKFNLVGIFHSHLLFFV